MAVACSQLAFYYFYDVNNNLIVSPQNPSGGSILSASDVLLVQQGITNFNKSTKLGSILVKFSGCYSQISGNGGQEDLGVAINTFQNLVSSIPAQPAQSQPADNSILNSLSQDVNNFFNGIVNLTSSVLDRVNSALEFLNNEFNDLVKAGFDFVENEFAELVYPLPADLPTKARERVPFIVSDGIKIALGVYVFSLAIDFVPTLRGSTLLNLAVFVQELYAVNKAIDAFNSNIVGSALAEPLRQLYNEKFRPTELSIDKALDAFYKSEIEIDDVIDVLRHEGYNEKRLDTIINTSNEPLSPNLMTRLARILPIPDSFIKATLFKNRIQGQDADYAFKAIVLDGVRTQLDQFVASVLTEYGLGILNDTQFDTYLNFGLVQGNEKIAVKNIGGIKAQTTYIKQKIAILISAFKQNFIDQATFKSYLSNLQLPENTINNIFIQALLDVGINPTELLLFPNFVFFAPSGMVLSFSIALT